MYWEMPLADLPQIRPIYPLHQLLRLSSLSLGVWWVIQEPPKKYDWIVFAHLNVHNLSPLLISFPLWSLLVLRLIYDVTCWVRVNISGWKLFWYGASPVILQPLPGLCEQLKNPSWRSIVEECNAVSCLVVTLWCCIFGNLWRGM